MPFKVQTGEPSMGETYTATERLALTRDGSQLVKDTDVRAASLYCVPGTKIPMAEAVRLGLLKSSEVAETKEIKPQATKGRKGK